MQTRPAGRFSAVGEGMAGGEVKESVIDFLQPPMRLQRKIARITDGPQRFEMSAPVYLAKPHGGAGRDEFSRLGRS